MFALSTRRTRDPFTTISLHVSISFDVLLVDKIDKLNGTILIISDRSSLSFYVNKL